MLSWKWRRIAGDRVVKTRHQMCLGCAVLKHRSKRLTDLWFYSLLLFSLILTKKPSQEKKWRGRVDVFRGVDRSLQLRTPQFPFWFNLLHFPNLARAHTYTERCFRCRKRKKDAEYQQIWMDNHQCIPIKCPTRNLNEILLEGVQDDRAPLSAHHWARSAARTLTA